MNETPEACAARNTTYARISEAVGAEMRQSSEIPSLDLSKPEDRRQALHDFSRSMRAAERASAGRFAYRSQHRSAQKGAIDAALRRADRRFFDAARKQAMDEREACIAIAAKFSKRAAAALRALPPLPEWSAK